MKITAFPMDVDLLIEFYLTLQAVKSKAALKYRPGKNTSLILEVDFEHMSEVYEVLEAQNINVHSDPSTGKHEVNWGSVNSPNLTLTFDVSTTTKTVVVPLDVDMIPWLQGATVEQLNQIHSAVNA